MRNFNKNQIEEYIQYINDNVLETEDFIGNCVICGASLNDLQLPDGPEKEIVCLKDRELFVADYEELIKIGIIKDTNTDGIIIKTDDEIREEELKKYTIDGLTLGEVIFLDWIHLKKKNHSTPAYFKHRHAVNSKSSCTKLNDEGYIRLATPFESIDGLLLNELKNILSKNKKKVTGKRKELLERVKFELTEKEYVNFIKPTWILTEKGHSFLNKYDVIIWANKKENYSVSPYNVFPYIHSNKSNEEIAISITKEKINEYLPSLEWKNNEIFDNCLFQSDMYYELGKQQESLNSFLLGFMFGLTGIFGYGYDRFIYMGAPSYSLLNLTLTSFLPKFFPEAIQHSAVLVYKSYERYLSEIRLYKDLTEFIEAIYIILEGTEEDWNDYVTNLENRSKEWTAASTFWVHDR